MPVAHNDILKNENIQPWLALDHHVASGRGEQVALIYDSPVTGTVRKFTYIQLQDEVARFDSLRFEVLEV